MKIVRKRNMAGMAGKLLALSLAAILPFLMPCATAYAEENREYVLTETKTYDTDDETKYDFGFEEEVSQDGVTYKLEHIEYEKTNVYESVYGEEGAETEILAEKEGLKNEEKENFKPKTGLVKNDMEYVFDSVTFQQSGHTGVKAEKTLETEVLPSLNLSEYPKSIEYEYDGAMYELPYSRYEENKGWHSFKLTGTIYGYDNGSFAIGETVVTNEQLTEADTLKLLMGENGYGADVYKPVSFEYASEPYTSVNGKVCRDYIINYEAYGSIYIIFYEKEIEAPLYRATVKYVLSDECINKLEEMKNSYEVTAHAYYIETSANKDMSPVTKVMLGAGIVFLIILFVALAIYLLKGGRKPTDYKSEMDIRKDYKELNKK